MESITTAEDRSLSRNPHNLSINTVTDTHHLGEIFSRYQEDGFVSDPFFRRSEFSFFDENHNAYFGQAPIPKFNLTPQDVIDALKPVPDEKVYPKAPTGITTASMPLGEGFYIKRPSFETVKQSGLFPESLLPEAEILERIKEAPHPNIIHYHGCIGVRGYIVGIVLTHYPETLAQRMRFSPEDLDKDRVMRDIEAGMRHLHSLGLAHNDLTPDRVMIGKDGQAVLNNFRSCKRLGEKLDSGWTYRRANGKLATSGVANDESALERIRTWMEADHSVGEGESDSVTRGHLRHFYSDLL